MSNQSAELSDVWYSLAGPDNDVVLSTRIRLARNLVNFPFPQGFKNNDGERVASLVFDAFLKVDENDYIYTPHLLKTRNLIITNSICYLFGYFVFYIICVL
jgi:protein-arginine kinase